MSLYVEFDRIVRALTAADIKFAVVGGLAVGLHGFIRATEDIDLLVAESDLSKAAQFLLSTGYIQNAESITFPESGLRMQRFYRRPPQATELLVVDLLCPVSDAMRSYLERAATQPYADTTIRVVQADDLIGMKKLRGSKTDAADIEFLQKRHERSS